VQEVVLYNSHKTVVVVIIIIIQFSFDGSYFSNESKRLAGKNASELTYFVSSGRKTCSSSLLREVSFPFVFIDSNGSRRVCC